MRAALRVVLRHRPAHTGRSPHPGAHAPGPPARHRARRTLLIGLLLVVAAQLGLTAAVETVRPEWRDPEYGHRLHRLRTLRAAHPGRPLVVAVGSSRTQMGLSPSDMGFPDEPGSPLVFNFGQAGAGPLHQLLTVRRLLDAGVRPDYLLVEFFPGALVVDGPAEEVTRGWGPRLGYADAGRLDPYAADPGELHRRWLSSRAVPWHTLRLPLMSHWQPRWLAWPQRLDFQWDLMDPHGFTPYPHPDVSPDKRADGLRLARDQYAPHFEHFRIGGTSDRALRDLLALARTEGIPTALYPMPESPAFREWYTPEARAAVAAYLPTLGAPVLDAAGGFTEDEFADGHHLLPAGAARFSRRLGGHLQGRVK